MSGGVAASSLGEPIAIGGTAEIYEWQPGWVLKLFDARFGSGMAEYERRLAAAICDAGLPVPRVGDIVQVAGREGLLYEKVDGITLGEDLTRRPWRIVSYSIVLADLHAEMHREAMRAEVPPLRRRLASKIREAAPLPEDVRTAALAALDEMPDGDRLCHGDFHLGNVMINGDGLTIIDWIDASIGSPLADVARTSILARGMLEAEARFSSLQRMGLRWMHALYLRRYFSLRLGGMDEYRRWLPIVAAGRLSEHVPGWDAYLLKEAGKILHARG